MKLSTKGRYAVMAVVDLAAATASTRPTLANDQTDGSETVSLAVIAERQGISRAYLEQLFMRLRRSGLVESQRGAQGGYRLARPPEDIAIADIVYAVDERIKATRCGGHASKGCLLRGVRCMTHDLWDELGRQIQVFLGEVTVADVIEGNVMNRSRLSVDADVELRGARAS